MCALLRSETELLTQSIIQRKLRASLYPASVFDPGCPFGLLSIQERVCLLPGMTPLIPRLRQEELYNINRLGSSKDLIARIKNSFMQAGKFKLLAALHTRADAVSPGMSLVPPGSAPVYVL